MEGKVTKPYGDDELRTTVHLPNIAPIGAKLRQNAFQTICNFRFFDAEQIFSTKIFGKKFRFGKRFSQFLGDFGGDRRVLTWKSDSLMNFASGTQVFSLVQPKNTFFVINNRFFRNIFKPGGGSRPTRAPPGKPLRGYGGWGKGWKTTPNGQKRSKT